MQKEPMFFCRGAQTIIDKVCANDPELTRVFLDTYPLTDKQVEQLADGLRSNTHVEYLNLFDCRLGNKHIKILIESLSANDSVRELLVDQDMDEKLREQLLCTTKCNRI
jgi:hypothetical protein